MRHRLLKFILTNFKRLLQAEWKYRATLFEDPIGSIYQQNKIMV